ncbi:recombination protein O N-terminal domain-containing protein [Patescibacteria group bacterium]|nr:recombination protein O N-terminal domain-containing protein [Patescibacteria group bacterium]MBU1034584.1 recombination protein O N-terminal domain-containing protein [Patescibacteria group bacterium]MBU1629804.1 recombination protein O N-terminal domain-containing protein [Patescibacteria group bacterium]MBU1908367.1 recombination protein O N-terminal domain-containing protein [Patescibacteria group bacterium]
MPYIRDRAFVLKKEPVNEHDRRYVLYGRDHGLLMAVARGASLRSSKQAGHLEPFTEAEIMIAKGRVWDKLAVARNVFDNGAGYEPLRALGALSVMGAFCDLLISLTRPGICDARVFDLLKDTRRACACMEKDASSIRAGFVFSGSALKLLDLLGYAPKSDEAFDEDVQKLVAFTRKFPLSDTLRITAASAVFTAFSNFVESSLEHTSLDKKPHGFKTVAELVG